MTELISMPVGTVDPRGKGWKSVVRLFQISIPPTVCVRFLTMYVSMWKKLEHIFKIML